jgi:hypothetical protein
MEEVIRNVADLDIADRRALERLIGEQLAEEHQVLIRVIEAASVGPGSRKPAHALEDWTTIYDGLSNEEIEAVDQVAKTRAKLTRNRP